MTRILVALFLSLPLIGAYGILAVGIVMIYRASRVLNLAHGGMMMIPPFILYSLREANVPFVVALPLAIASGAALGMLIERVFIRPLRDESVTAQTVGTVAALGLLIAIAGQVWGTTSLPAVGIFPEGRIDVALSSIRYGEIGLFFAMLAVTAILVYVFNHTDVGLMMRGSAENRRAAALMGVNPERATSLAWAIGGTLAAVTGILLASITNLHPYVLALQALPGFVAALIGGLGTLTAAVVGAAVVGATQGLVPVLGPLGEATGAPQLFLAILAIVVMATRGRRITGGDIRETGGLGSKTQRAVSSTITLAKEARPLRERPAFLAGVLVAVLFPWMPFVPFSLLGNANRAAQFGLVALSLVVLVGWVGQISLGHAALVGIGAYVTGWMAGGLGVPFPANLPFAAAAAALVASVLGIVAVRVRGLYLAVATLIFSWMADAFLFRQGWFIRHAQVENRPVGESGTFPFFDFADRRTFYLISWALVGLAVLAAANLKQSKTGRAFFAVQGSEMAAAALGIDVVRYKVLAFAFSGFLAGAAGSLAMTNALNVVPESFAFNVSFFYLSIAVVGGLRSIGGAVAAGVLFAGLTEIFFRVEALGGYLDIVSAGLLVVVLLAYREGIAAIPVSLARFRPALESFRATLRSGGATTSMGPAIERLRTVVSGVSRRALTPVHLLGAQVRRVPGLAGISSGRLGDWPVLVEGAIEHAGVATLPSPTEQSIPEQPSAETADAGTQQVEEPSTTSLAERGGGFGTAAPGSSPRPRAEDRSARRPLVEADEVTVRFGGLVAVGGATMSVREGEIVGLIGPNGAGKTTLFNAIAGLVGAADGRVRLFGQDVTELPVHERAKLGVARTFQLIQLFPQLSVFDNLLVATHVHNPTGVLSHVFATPSGLGAEVAVRRRVRRVISAVGLRDVADARVADLPFGVLRMVEVARALVTGFPLIMLDEPASGLDNRETDILGEYLVQMRDRGVTLLLIEHDVALVTAVSDYIYVLERGRLIAEGPPEVIKRDPAVIAAYLGEEDATA